MKKLKELKKLSLRLEVKDNTFVGEKVGSNVGIKTNVSNSFRSNLFALLAKNFSNFFNS